MKTNQANKAHGPPGRVVGQGPTADVGNRRFTDAALLPPNTGRLFYVIQDREDGLVDVYLMPFRGVTLVVRGVVLPEAERRVDAVGRLAEDVRARYYAWCESGEKIYI